MFLAFFPVQKKGTRLAITYLVHRYRVEERSLTSSNEGSLNDSLRMLRLRRTLEFIPI